jgi:hypothetical protein
MKTSYATDYETYSQIKWELHRPIQDEGLEFETLERLYESKLVYLERLRIKCFSAINSKTPSAFTMQDYRYILIAVQTTKEQVRQLADLYASSEPSKFIL